LVTDHGLRNYPPEVTILNTQGREIILVGTAHVSRESVNLVRQVIERERPDTVCLELDSRRYEALSQQRYWETLDLRQVIRKRQLATLLVNLVLSSYQKRLGMKLGVMPGSELLEASLVAKELGIEVALCDRDIRITLRRTWAALSFYRKSMLLTLLLASLFERPELTEQEIDKIRQQDVLSEVLKELGDNMPELKRVLIDERDAYLAQKIRQVSGRKVVAVIGAGHLAGMSQAISEAREVDLAELETVPPVPTVWKALGWSIPLVILGSIGYIWWAKGLVAAGNNVLYWFFANAIPAGIGCALAFAHPAAIASAFFSAPFTTLSPLIGSGHVAALAQAYFQPPLVNEFQTLSEDVASLKRWWLNRVLRIFLVLFLTSLGGIIGVWIGGVGVVSNIFK
jgi:pheromone shutdown-related protein TraB